MHRGRERERERNVHALTCTGTILTGAMISVDEAFSLDVSPNYILYVFIMINNVLMYIHMETIPWVLEHHHKNFQPEQI